MTTEANNNDVVPYNMSRLDNLTFGGTLKSWRLCEAWTLKQMAEKLGISAQMLHQLETGKRLPSPEKAVEISNILGMGAEASLVILINQQLKKANLPYRVQSLAS
jgi:transcriptional regulator with XRE-family HTH domain